MSYNPSIPASTSKRPLSARQIRANYQTIYQAFSNNHGNLDDDFFKGKHRAMVFRDQTAPGTTANQVALYNKIVGGVPNLFYQPNNSQTEIQLTYQTLSVNPASSTQYTFMAGPFIVHMGKVSNPSNPENIGPLSPGTNILYVGTGTVRVDTPPLLDLNYLPINVAGMSFTLQATSVIPPPFDVYYIAIASP